MEKEPINYKIEEISKQINDKLFERLGTLSVDLGNPDFGS